MSGDGWHKAAGPGANSGKEHADGERRHQTPLALVEMRKRKRVADASMPMSVEPDQSLKDMLGEPAVNDLFAYRHSGHKRKEGKALNAVSRE